MSDRWSNGMQRRRDRYTARLVGSTGHLRSSRLRLQRNLGDSVLESDHDHCQNVRKILDITKGKASQV